MNELKEIKHFILFSRLFFTIYILSGLYFLLLFLLVYVNLTTHYWKIILFFIYFSAPLMIISVGLIKYYKKKKTSIYFWLCSIYWFIICFSEVIEKDIMVPNKIFIITMLIVSILCMLFLFFQRKIRTIWGQVLK
jgi:hypothetical protein